MKKPEQNGDYKRSGQMAYTLETNQLDYVLYTSNFLRRNNSFEMIESAEKSTHTRRHKRHTKIVSEMANRDRTRDQYKTGFSSTRIRILSYLEIPLVYSVGFRGISYIKTCLCAHNLNVILSVCVWCSPPPF